MHHLFLRGLCFIFVVCALSACATRELPCEGTDNIEVVCSFDNPEDFAIIPDSDFLVVSEYGFKHANLPSPLSMLNMKTREKHILFPSDAHPQTATSKEVGWGDPDCDLPTAESFSPHGLHLTRRDGNRLQLLVVNHAGKNAVEFFEILLDEEIPRALWRGCVNIDKSVVPNSVKWLPQGGFLVTHMGGDLSKIDGVITSAQGLLGMDTGYVLRWDSENGIRRQPGGDGPMPNGIEVSPDGRFMYLNIYFASEVRKIRIEDGERIATADVTHPDNINWGANNQLLVASQSPSFFDMARCFQIKGKSCAVPFNVVAVDGDTMKTKVVFSSTGAPLPVATAAAYHDNRLYTGTFAGDRIGIISDVKL